MLFYQRSAELLAWFHGNRGPVGKIATTARGVPVGISEGGDLVVPLYFDYASWSKEASEFTDHLRSFAKKIGASRVVLVSPGQFSERGAKELSSLGVEVVDPGW